MPPLTNLPPSRRSFNVAAAIIGFLVFVGGIWLLITVAPGGGLDYKFCYFVICIGLGLLLFAIGDEAKIVSTRYSITGASGIAIILYVILNNVIQENKIFAKIEISASDSVYSSEMMESSSKNRPVSSAIIYNDGFLSGDLQKNPYSYIFKFNIDKSIVGAMDGTECPRLVVSFADGRQKRKSFLNHRVLSVDNKYYFNLIFKIDKDKLSYKKDQSWSLLDDCETAEGKQIVDVAVQAAAERDTSKMPGLPASPSVVINATPSVSPTVAPIPQKQAVPAASPLPAEVADNPALHKIIGYVVTSQLAQNSGQLEKNWFEVEGKEEVLIPVQNDVIVLNYEKAVVRAQPFHWDVVAQRHVVSNPVYTMKQGQKARVGGDATLVRDETNRNAWYIIVPIVEILGENIDKNNDLYPKADLQNGVDGYVYVGYLDKGGLSLSDKSFENFSSPDSLYPAPNDVLVAKSNIWLRQGPRRWDFERKTYTKPSIVKSIQKGDYIKVSGDIAVAKGLSLWIPISKSSSFVGVKAAEMSVWKKIEGFFQQ